MCRSQPGRNGGALASMGPRSCERGNVKSASRCIEYRLLQWGRARASAEMAQQERRGRRPDRASMGPRSCERGNGGERGDDVARRRASMGPRSCERGNARIADRVSRIRASLQWGRARASAEICGLIRRRLFPLTCFNGAALVRARKLCLCVLERNRLASFNGAALVRARKWKKSPNAEVASCRLQWGRARASAEILGLLRFILSRRRASMGPRSCERGNEEKQLATVTKNRLASMGPRSCERGNGQVVNSWG